MAELDKRPISKLPEEASPSTSAVLVGVDEGETVKIPITEFAKAEHEHSEYAKTSDIPSLEGYAKTTDLFSKDYNDLKNKPSIPSIAGLATTAYVDQKVSSMSGGSSGGTGGASIIDITDFPSNPSTTSIYRKWQVTKTEWVMDGVIVTNGSMTCDVVNTLPEVGEMCYTGSAMYSYYQRADGECYGYVDSNLSAMMGVPVGWYPASTLFVALGRTYNGMIDSLASATDGYSLLLTKKPHLYHFYNDGEGNAVKSAIITNDNYEFDENLGTLTQVIVL